MDDFWLASSNVVERKLPPLRPIVRSRTFTIITTGEDQESGCEEDSTNWEESEQADSDEGISDGETNEDHDAEEDENLLRLVVKLPNGQNFERYFDTDDTLENVFSKAIQEYNEGGLTEIDEKMSDLQLIADEDPVRVFEDLKATLGESEVNSKTGLVLRFVKDS